MRIREHLKNGGVNLERQGTGKPPKEKSGIESLGASEGEGESRGKRKPPQTSFSTD